MATKIVNNMKKIYILIAAVLLLVACEAGSNDSATADNFGGEGQGGSLAAFALRNNYLYTVDQFGLNVFSLADIQNPVLLNTVDISFDIETIFSLKEYLYIGSQSGMFIYSIENPEFPEYVSSVEHFTACDPVIANENTAFVTLWSDLGCGTTINQLEVYDISEITTPVLLNVRELTFPKGMGLYDDFLFVCDDEIKIFNISDPTNTTLVHSIDRLAFDVIIRGDLLIAIGENGLYQYSLDPTNIENIVALSTIDF